ncbi:MAG: hypothetical protein AAF664_25640, partial [Planctomycetota bacterium]
KDCYVLWKRKEPFNDLLQGTLEFAKEKPEDSDFHLATDLARSIPDFKNRLAKQLMMEPDHSVSNGVSYWERFIARFKKVNGFVRYRPAMLRYLDDAFQTLVNDNIHYVEIRVPLSEFFDLDGNSWRDVDYLLQYRSAFEMFKAKNPSFNMRLIICESRCESRQHILEAFHFASKMWRDEPSLVCGFDLMGEESREWPSEEIMKTLAAIRAKDTDASTIPLYLHAGETTWGNNQNVSLACEAQCKRIGHGLNLVFAPETERILREQDIALEICPISNQRLGYVNDLRLHPGVGYQRRGVSCVLASDDPMIFGNHGLSFDFWSVWMAWDLSLDEMRVLAGNSILYSGLGPEQGAKLLHDWTVQWADFERELATQRF